HQIAYIPAGQTHPAHFPSLFNALAQREVAEVYEQDQTFLLNKQTTPHGTLYVARNITIFEQREDKFTALTFILVGLISILSWWLARVTLMCEKLSWRLDLKSELDHGTQIELFFQPA
ncbi:MAG: hypothetical protein GX332_02305, partial [Alcaligenaceae bacterium]|nr:hypothetical protein [Alcaligenaceae bacterium]